MTNKLLKAPRIVIVLRCPFCDSLAINIKLAILRDKYWYVCDNCSGMGPVGNSQQEALGKWNKRVYNPGTREDGDTVENYGHRT